MAVNRLHHIFLRSVLLAAFLSCAASSHVVIMNFFSKAADKPNARTRSSQQPVHALAPQPIPTWSAYYLQHLALNPPPPSRDVLRHLDSTRADFPPAAPSPAINRLIKLWCGDITKLRIGAIVNAANSGMWAGGGICGAIHSAAGSALEADCERWVNDNGKVPTGQTLVTRAYKLPADYVFHTVGPTDGSWDKLRRYKPAAHTDTTPPCLDMSTRPLTSGAVYRVCCGSVVTAVVWI